MFAQRLRRRPEIETALGEFLCLLGLLCGWRIAPPGAKKNTTQILPRYIGPPTVTLGQHYSNFMPSGPNHEYNREYVFFSQHFLNMQRLDRATSNVIFGMFIRTVPQKFQSFSTHGTPLSANWDTNFIAINFLGFLPSAGPNEFSVFFDENCIFRPCLYL